MNEGSHRHRKAGSLLTLPTAIDEAGHRPQLTVLRRILRPVGGLAGAISAGVLAFGTSTFACFYVGARSEYGQHSPGQLAVAILGIIVFTAWAAKEVRAATLDDTPKSDILGALRAGAQFSGVLMVLYACDRTSLFAKASKVQDSRSFWTVWIVICVAAICTAKLCAKPRVLTREQTDEWKGWMQLMFLMYHYFVEVKLYNAIRIYIAAYVWMTGYGNFLYYQKTGNFGAVRVAQTLFRLNFLALFSCLLLRNEYMLYYICPMHTLFTLFVWLALRIRTHLNQSVWVMLKVVVTLGCVYALYDIEPLFRIAFGWRPLIDLLAFHDPLHPEYADELHEWQFRSGLDRFAWIWGMACAALQPSFETGLDRIDHIESFTKRLAARTFLVAIVTVPTLAWIIRVFLLDKYSYNTVHPYTSWLPLSVYVLLRNLTPSLRARYMGLFANLGKITLETYILQFHVWMKTTGLNGSPKFILQLVPQPASTVPDARFWANFALVSAFYIFLSDRAFRLTSTLKDALIPIEPTKLPYTLATTFICCAAAYLAGIVVHSLLHRESVSPLQ